MSGKEPEMRRLETSRRFEAKCAADVRDVNEIACVPFARIVAAAEIGVDE